ncbi:pilus assembly protein TadB [Pseudactinotalea sp. HY160]|uniref:type II secretion system F family protein n=1 Tax=Pseudactinotalea sp. HY160 TaxID=2654490 RepID=UPI00128E9308|nr:type II secretion system F family protein [Pseudactinotalea sp. HY160]MPV49887.1 pilus assembly protein TadB [Pseudactinotalea sp. HY160]
MTESLSATGAVVGLLFGLGAALVAWRVSARRPRLIDRVGPYLREAPATSALLAARATPFPYVERVIAPVLTDIGRLLERLGSRSGSIERRLVRTGAEPNVEAFRIEQVLWAVGGLAGGLALALLVGATRGVRLVPLTVLVLLCALTGALLRDHLLTRAVRDRERAMAAEFPTVAELLALAISAGESPLAALERLAATTSGVLAAEIDRTLADVRSGRGVAEALERMAGRTDLPAIARFTDGVATAIERGTPLAEVLQSQAVDARVIGHRELMEAAGRKEVAMMIPVVFLILPITVLFALFPGLSVLSLG